MNESADSTASGLVTSIVVIEHDGRRVKRTSLNAIALARQLGGTYGLMVLGCGVGALADTVRSYGAAVVFVADDPLIIEPLADRDAAVIAQLANHTGADFVLGTSSTYIKDVLPRVAAMLDAPMVSDVMEVEIKDAMPRFQRQMRSGTQRATVKVKGRIRVITALGTAFPTPAPNCQQSRTERFPVIAASIPRRTEFVSRAQSGSTRPDLTETGVVVCGGRPLKDKATFDRLIGGLADTLGGAVGATRAAVDAGLAPNDCQVGQTGKVIAPELYIAVGISGAMQHLAGIRDSRIIVAINRDPDAPIFKTATYGLVGDLYEIVPRLIAAIRP